MTDEEEQEIVLVLAPVHWGKVDDPFDTTICFECGTTCWLSKPAQLHIDENPKGKVVCVACYLEEIEKAPPEEVLDVSTGKQLDPLWRRMIERYARNKLQD